jgi:hypothetical protein
MITDDPRIKAMREINPAFVSAVRSSGAPVALKDWPIYWS